jgi:hypothetical protein
MQVMKGKYSCFPIGNMLWKHVNMFKHTDYIMMKLDIISVSFSAYTSTGLMIPLSFINTEKSSSR